MRMSVNPTTVETEAAGLAAGVVTCACAAKANAKKRMASTFFIFRKGLVVSIEGSKIEYFRHRKNL